MFTRLHALRLGADGDLGLAYRKVILLDADVLPLRGYDRLWALDPPAGIVNEHKSHLVHVGADGRYHVPSSVHADGTWHWHRIYACCPHGARIPRAITDRVREDPNNLGICGCLFVLEPSMDEFRRIREDIARPAVARLVGEVYDWPDMQYLTLRWSGRWRNVDLRYAAHCGYPELAALYGTHYAGLKPWQVEHKSMRCYARHDDFALWFRRYGSLMARYPALRRIKRLDRLLGQVRLIAAKPGSPNRTPAPAPRGAYSGRSGRRGSRRRVR
jgi:glycogenin glucosyltransferase